MATVLLIEDEPSVRLIVRVNFELHGLAVLEAGDGQTGLQLAREAHPDVIVLDVMLPEIDGWQIAAELLSDPRTRQIPIVFVTAHADSSTRERALAMGAADYVTKPFDPIALASRIEEIVTGSGRGE